MKALGIIAAGLLLVSCNDDFMDRYPLDSMSDENFWSKPADLESYSNRFYPSLLNPESFRSLDDQSDIKVPRTANGYLYNEYVIPSSGGGWAVGDWSNIRAANYFLVRAPQVQGDQELIDSYIAEVRFFRANEYFQKVKRFGDVPWLSKDLQTNDGELLYQDRDSRTLVVDSIMADLDFAIEHLNEKGMVETGRLHKDAARLLKARIALYEGTFRKYHNQGEYQDLLQTAAQVAQDIIETGNYSLYQTGNPQMDYYSLFIQEDLTSNPEVILARSFIQDIQMHNVTRQMEEAYTGLSKEMVESYLSEDGLPIALSDLYEGDETFEQELSNRDPRLLQTIDNQNIPFKLDNSGNPVYNELPIIDPNYCTTGYCVVKFHSPEEEQWNANQATTDLIIYRYAEALLIYAEAKAELGTITQADLDMSINKLRGRVGMPPLNVSVGFTDPNWPDYGYDLTPLLYEIRRERKVELAAEGFRWDDLVRWKAGELIEEPKTTLGMRITPEMAERYGSRVENIALTPEGYIDVYPDRGNRVWDEKLYLYPIPYQQLILNPEMDQNPSWE